MVKRLPAMQETRVRFLGWAHALEKEVAPHSSTLAWRIPWTEPGRLQSMGSQESDTTERLHFHFHFQEIVKDREAWRASVPGMAKSRT